MLVCTKYKASCQVVIKDSHIKPYIHSFDHKNIYYPLEANPRNLRCKTCEITPPPLPKVGQPSNNPIKKAFRMHTNPGFRYYFNVGKY